MADQPDAALMMRRELRAGSALAYYTDVPERGCTCDPEALINIWRNYIVKEAAPKSRKDRLIDPAKVIPAMVKAFGEQNAKELRRFANVFIHSPRVTWTLEAFQNAFYRVIRWDNLRPDLYPYHHEGHVQRVQHFYRESNYHLWEMAYYECAKEPEVIYKDHALGWQPVQDEQARILSWTTVKIGLKFSLFPIGNMWKYEAALNGYDRTTLDKLERKPVLWEFMSERQQEVFDHAQDLVYRITHGARTG